jgi:DNA invertase Pin-like site-specific DNA recombinase
MLDGLSLMTRIHAAGATIDVLDRKALDLTTPMGKALLGLLSAVFEEERVRIKARARQGIAEARRRNRRFGRKPKLTAEAAQTIRVRIRRGDSYRQIAAAYDVHHQTIARIARHRKDHA